MADWTVEVGGEVDLPATLSADVERAALHALAAEKAGDTRLWIAFVTDETIAGLKRQYLSQDGPTDVISFPLEQPGRTLVGDVYIGWEQAARQAVEAAV